MTTASLYHSSFSLLLGHEDKTYPGALIASLSIPWGEAKGDADNGGYHLVWTRDMVGSASAMLAAGDRVTTSARANLSGGFTAGRRRLCTEFLD